MARSSEPDASGINSEAFEKTIAAIQSGHSVLVLGEAGSGLDEFAKALYDRCAGLFNCAIATYKGSGKKFFEAIAQQLDIPTEVTDDNGKTRALTMDGLKEEIAQNVNEDTLLIFPESKRLTTGIRYWLEDLIEAGVKIVCLAAVNLGRDIFLQMIEIEMELPSDRTIRQVMESEAQRQGMTLSNSRLAELQPLAGRNPMLAKKVIQRERLGIQQDVQHTQYVVIMPVIVAALFAFAVVRFVGMGTGNKSLYITGGMCLVTAMALKQLGNVRGARKRLGQ